MSDDVPNAILFGGPAERLPEHERLRRISDPSTTKIKVLLGNRYEHFVTDVALPSHDDGLRVFVWSGTTYVAE